MNSPVARIRPPLPAVAQAEANRLAPRLLKANLYQYRLALVGMAQGLKLSAPGPITDYRVTERLAQQARESALSIANTRLQRMKALSEQYGLGNDALDAYQIWQDQQNAMIAAYEASRARQQAMDDFASMNNLAGEEWVEPFDAVCTHRCVRDIERGRQPVGTFMPYPAHFRCPHRVIRFFENLPEDKDSLWFGQGPTQAPDAPQGDEEGYRLVTPYRTEMFTI